MFFHFLPDLDRFKEIFASVHFLRHFPKEPEDDDAFICEIKREFVSFIFSHNEVNVVFKLPTDRFEDRFFVIVDGTERTEKRFYVDQPDVGIAIDSFITSSLLVDYDHISFMLRSYVTTFINPIPPIKEEEPEEEKEIISIKNLVPDESFLRSARRPRAFRTIDEIIDRS